MTHANINHKVSDLLGIGNKGKLHSAKAAFVDPVDAIIALGEAALAVASDEWIDNCPTPEQSQTEDAFYGACCDFLDDDDLNAMEEFCMNSSSEEGIEFTLDLIAANA